MRLVILDYLGSSLSEDILKLKIAVFLIPPECSLPNSVQIPFKNLEDVDVPIQPGFHVVRTSDDCLRGVILGKLTQKYPDVIVYSSRPETISRYIQTCKVEPWPNDLSSYANSEKMTIRGPAPDSFVRNEKVDVSPNINPVNLQIYSGNEPKPLQRSEKQVLVEPLKPNNIAAPPNPMKKEPVHDKNDAIIKKYFEHLFNLVTENQEFCTISNFGGLYSLVHVQLRELGPTNSELYNNDKARLKLVDQVCLRILEYGFFEIIDRISIAELIENKNKYQKVGLRYNE